MTLLFDHDLKRIYARALIAIARADAEIDTEEGERLKTRIEERCELHLEDLLLEASVDADQLVDAIRGGPFRGSAVRGDQVARLLVEDGLFVALGKGHISPEEADQIWRYAAALGLSNDEFRRMTERWIP